MAKTERVILDKDEVCLNPYCNTAIKRGEHAVKVSHLLDKFPEYYHDEECARKSPNAPAIRRAK